MKRLVATEPNGAIAMQVMDAPDLQAMPTGEMSVDAVAAFLRRAIGRAERASSPTRALALRSALLSLSSRPGRMRLSVLRVDATAGALPVTLLRRP